MRYRLAVLMLIAVLPMMSVLAAPAPDPWAILDIGPPPKGGTAEQYRKRQIEGQTSQVTLSMAWNVPEVRKLPSVAPLKDARPWLAENLRVTAEEEGRRLRFSFRAGNTAEQVTIINAFLRANLKGRGESIKFLEECLRCDENRILELEKRIESGQYQELIDSYREAINGLRFIRIPERRAEIARLKQVAVVRWAK